TGSRESIRAVVTEDADKALQLAPQSAEAHLALARKLMYLDWDWSRASIEMQRALDLGANLPAVRRSASYLSSFLGRWQEAVEHAREAAHLDPLSSYNFYILGDAQEAIFSFEDAEKSYRNALSLSPIGRGYHSSLASALWYQGRRAEAVAEAAREADEYARLGS